MNTELEACRVLVTGATGFLGAAICRQLLTEGISVRAAGHTRCTPINNLNFVPIDVLKPETIRTAMCGVTHVIHAAGLAHVFHATQDAAFDAVNVGGTANVVNAAADAGVRYFILASSVAVYGGSAKQADECTPCRPETAYALSKRQSEQRAVEIAQRAGMSLAILRFATLYGEGDRGNVARLMRSIDRGRFIWIGDGANRKSLLHQQDAARACSVVLRASNEGINTYNVAAAAYRMRDIVNGIAFALGRRVSRLYVPAPLALNISKTLAAMMRGYRRARALDVMVQKWLADDIYVADKFAHVFDFRPIVDLEIGLRRQVMWYRNLMR